MNTFNVSYVTTLPKEGNAPRVFISGDDIKQYHIYVYDLNGQLHTSGFCKTNEVFICKTRQWFTNWHIIIMDESGDIVFEDKFNPENKVVFIKFDSLALGDTIAWIPYVEEFAIFHRCKVICSTFYNDLLVDSYPNIMFVKPNISIENVYAQYYIGAINEDNPYYSPVKSNEVPLQTVASQILGLDHEELMPNLAKPFIRTKPRMTKKYVTLSEFGSSPDKSWKAENGWQSIVDALNSMGYEVLVISKEPTTLKNVIDLTGNHTLIDRMIDIYHAEFHLGVSSGLSWLAWALGKHVFMISDVTPEWHEFHHNSTRLSANKTDRVNYAINEVTSASKAVEKLVDLVSSRYL